MSTLHGFDLVCEQAIPERHSVARIYRHARTGARLLSVLNDDENKAFGIAFRIPVTDSTGVAHILEHSVLCGSRKYPVKRVFAELAESSLNTFLNAFTYPDKTCYVVASQNLQDFYNLIDVYLDAVFHPLISLQTFHQEGWHYELDTGAASMSYKGVVFNEMKGAYSSPDRRLSELSRESLFPDTIYGVDSAGDPKHIPDLTYRQFKALHERYYHPSNAWLYFYGDDDPHERLRLLDAQLGAFGPAEIDSTIALQPRISAPARLTSTYAAGPDDRSAKAMMAVSWMLGEIAESETRIALAILAFVLIGTPASPLQKALLDSGLGEAPANLEFDDSLRQSTFSAGLKGVNPRDVDKVEALILDTLGGLAASGIAPPPIEAAVNTLEFSWREHNTGDFPRGLALMASCLPTWLHGGDPVATLAFEKPLAAVKARLANGERYLEALITQYLLDNPHRTTVVLRPDATQGQREEEEERARLHSAYAAMSEADIAELRKENRSLERMQATPDPPEARATIPVLTLGDLPRHGKAIPIEASSVCDTRVLYHDLPTDGVAYIYLGFDLRKVPVDLLPYVPLLCVALVQTGVAKHDDVELSRWIGRATGGVHASWAASAMPHSDDTSCWLFLSGKVMSEKAGELLAILRSVLLEARLDNRQRIRQLVSEEKAGQEAAVTSSAAGFVNVRLRAGLHGADRATEQMSGVDYLLFLRNLSRQVESNWDAVRAALEKLRQVLIDRAGMIVNVTCDATSWRRFEPQLPAFLTALPLARNPSAGWRLAPIPAHEGLIAPVQVNAVGKGANLFDLGYGASGATAVVINRLSGSWLWDKIRVEGGAYGSACHLDRHSGGLTMLSWEDPNLLATLAAFDQSAEFLRSTALSQADVTRSIIRTIGDVDTYRLPEAKGSVSMWRFLLGETDEDLQRRREEILATGVADFRKFAEVLQEVALRGRVVALGSEAAIAAANAERPGFLTTTRLI
jgi:Zn-dependent M16 (insulinase) family peptidase